MKPLAKEESLSTKPESSSRQNNNLDEDSKQIHGPHSLFMKGKMTFDIVHGLSANQFSKDKVEPKEKKEVEKLSELDFKELCKKNMDKYPKLYQFLEKFSEKIMETALRYEIAERYVNILEKWYRIETPQQNNFPNSSQP